MITYVILLVAHVQLMGLPAIVYVSHPSMQSCHQMLDNFEKDLHTKTVECVVKQYRST